MRPAGDPLRIGGVAGNPGMGPASRGVVPSAGAGKIGKGRRFGQGPPGYCQNKTARTRWNLGRPCHPRRPRGRLPPSQRPRPVSPSRQESATRCPAYMEQTGCTGQPPRVIPRPRGQPRRVCAPVTGHCNAGYGSRAERRGEGRPGGRGHGAGHRRRSVRYSGGQRQYRCARSRRRTARERGDRLRRADLVERRKVGSQSCRFLAQETYQKTHHRSLSRTVGPLSAWLGASLPMHRNRLR